MLAPPAKSHWPAVFESVQASKTRCGGTPKRRARRILTGCFASMSVIPREGPNPGPTLDSATCIVRSPSRLDAQLKLNPPASNRTRFEARVAAIARGPAWADPIRDRGAAYSSIDEEACAVLPICIDLAEC